MPKKKVPSSPSGHFTSCHVQCPRLFLAARSRPSPSLFVVILNTKPRINIYSIRWYASFINNHSFGIPMTWGEKKGYVFYVDSAVSPERDGDKTSWLKFLGGQHQPGWLSVALKRFQHSHPHRYKISVIDEFQFSEMHSRFIDCVFQYSSFWRPSDFSNIQSYKSPLRKYPGHWRFIHSQIRTLKTRFKPLSCLWFNDSSKQLKPSTKRFGSWSIV